MARHRVPAARRSGSARRTSPAVGFASVLRQRTFGTVFVAESQSIIGDQLARIALSVLVFDASRSAALTASIYAVTFLPAVLGGVLLTGVGDRLSRRGVMIAVDVLRAALFAVMALPAVPLPAVTVLLVVAVLIGPVFTSAAVALLADTMSPDQFRSGTGLRMIANQAAQVAGFGAGGAVVVGVGSRGALAVNAGTYVVSVLLIATLPRVPGAARRPSTAAARPGVGVTKARVVSLVSTPTVAWLMGLSALTGAFVVPEGLAVPFGSEIGASTGQVGLLLASIPLGTVLGVAVLVYVVPSTGRAHAMRLMCLGCGAPLVLVWLRPAFGVAVALLLVSGFLAAYVMEAMTALVAAVPADLRAGLVGVSSAVMLGAQGLGLATFGLLASATSAATAIGAAGVTGVVGAAAFVALRRRMDRHVRPPMSDIGTLAFAKH